MTTEPTDGLFPPESVDTTTADDANDPHEVDENPELHIGEELLDPWKDATALDWPNDEDDEDEN
jgi:hypothetical protein